MSTPPSASGNAAPTLFCLHALGSSAREFDLLSDLLDGQIEVVGLDLPGFGDLSAASGTGVDEMVASVERRIRSHGAARWMLLGHSMGGKVASLVAARTLSGDAALFGLAGIVLVAGSPPVPEPMDESRRDDMRDWAAKGPLDRENAQTFIDANTAAPLTPDANARALADLQRTSPEAWLAWLDRGSREDRAEDVGSLDLPALVVSGAEDGDLGTSAQRELHGRVYPRARFHEVAEAAHLIPLERPRELAESIRRFWSQEAGIGPALSSDWTRLLASPRVAPRTRGILARRAVADRWAPTGHVLGASRLATLRALAEQIVPQEEPRIDLAARLDADLARGTDDGWRSAALPRDAEAHAIALDALSSFADLTPPERDELLTSLAAGERGLGALDAAAAAAWFEDLTAHLARIWLAHPATLARVGFDGFANGTHSRDLLGYRLLAAGEREAWEPGAHDGHEKRSTGKTAA